MGLKVEGFELAMTEIAQRHDPSFDATTLEIRHSKGGNYLGVTLTVLATSRAQLDALYRELTGHPLVKVVL
jgi:putative lipoic acid-binding regulatory protein